MGGRVWWVSGRGLHRIDLRRGCLLVTEEDCDLWEVAEDDWPERMKITAWIVGGHMGLERTGEWIFECLSIYRAAIHPEALDVIIEFDGGLSGRRAPAVEKLLSTGE